MRSVAQPGSASALGAECRGFKSRRSDQPKGPPGSGPFGFDATSKRREGILGGLDKVVNVGVGVGGGKEVDLELGRLEINAGA